MATQMTDPEHTSRGPRVVLGATCYVDAEGALSLAVALARSMKADLHGLLVQDEAILSAANRPRAQAVSYSGLGTTGITADAMQQAFEADARRFEQMITAAARAAAVSAAFRADAGGLAEALRQTARAGDLAVFGFRRATRDSGSLVLLLGERDDAPEFAAPLAKALGKRLVLLRYGQQNATVAHLASHGTGPEALFANTAQTVLRHLERLSPAAVIMTAYHPDMPPISRIIDAARCPVIFAAPADGDAAGEA